MARAARLSGRFDTVVFGGCLILALVASALPTPMRDPVAASLRRTLVAPLVGLQRSAERWRAAWLESERKTLERDSIALALFQRQALEVENDRLRKLLGLGSRLTWGFVPAEALHTSGRAEDVTTTLTLTAGSDIVRGFASSLTDTSSRCARRASIARRVGSASAAKVRSSAVE